MTSNFQNMSTKLRFDAASGEWQAVFLDQPGADPFTASNADLGECLKAIQVHVDSMSAFFGSPATFELAMAIRED